MVMDFTLTDEQHRLQRLTRDFAYREIQPRARELDARQGLETFPVDLLRRASQLGLRTLRIPCEHGGLGSDLLTEVIVLEELAVGDCGFAMTLAHPWREGYLLARHTTLEQRERFLPEFLRDDTFLTSWAISEDHAGSDHNLPYAGDLDAGLRTSAVQDGDSWVLNGRKRFITNGNVARLVLLFARTEPGRPWTEGTSAFLVPSEAPGFRVGRTEDKLGLRCNQNVELVFEDCRIPADNLVGELHGGYHVAELAGPGSKTREATRALGVARACLEAASAWCAERVQGGQKLADHESISVTLAEMATEIELARSLIWRAAWAVDHDPDRFRPLEDMAKVSTAEMAMRIATRTMQLFGARGALREHPIEKLVRDAATIMLPPVGNQASRVRLSRWLAAHPEVAALVPDGAVKGARAAT
jgi:alkylation response protein AidB-like acyl-CoA dehydrogenase